MYQHRLGYRFLGTIIGKPFVEGFVGTAASGKDKARELAIGKVKAKCLDVKEEFDPTRLIELAKDVTADELKEIQANWEVSARSSRV